MKGDRTASAVLSPAVLFARYLQLYIGIFYSVLGTRPVEIVILFSHPPFITVNYVYRLIRGYYSVQNFISSISCVSPEQRKSEETKCFRQVSARKHQEYAQEKKETHKTPRYNGWKNNLDLYW